MRRHTEPGETILAVRVQPGAAADRVAGYIEDTDGTRLLKLRVTAAPDKGRANRAVIALIARTTGLPKSAVSIIAGGKSRTKTLRLEAPPETVLPKLADRGGAPPEG